MTIEAQADARRAFWSALQVEERALLALPQRERVDALNALLSPAFPDLAAEVEGDEESGRFTLVLSSHGAVGHFEEMLALFNARPALTNIDVVAFRQRTGQGFGMRMDDFELESKDVLLKHSADRGQIALAIAFAKPIPMDLQDHARNMAFIMLDHLLGEYDFAVKVGAVDFTDDAADGLPLDDFVAVFDDFWRGELGHNGAFAHGEQRWSALEATRQVDGEEVTSFVQRNDSANTLVGRADLCHCISITLPVQAQADLDAARELEDRLVEALQRPEEGCQSLVVFGAGRRTVSFYVADAQHAMARAQAIAGALKLDPHFELDFDPAWNDYCRWLP